MNIPTKLWMTYLAAFAFFLAVSVVILGAFTRLSDAGLGCPDWPTCYGHLWVPNSHADVVLANINYAHTPVEHDKTWPEQTHRLLASLLGVTVLTLFVVAQKYFAMAKTLRWLNILLLCLIAGVVMRALVGAWLEPVLWLLIGAYFCYWFVYVARHKSIEITMKISSLVAGLVMLQGLFGMWTVTLKLWPQVVTLHLLGGFFTLTALWLVWRILSYSLNDDANISIKTANKKWLQKFSLLVLVMVIGQISLGGWTSSNYAALACPDIPQCQNQWIPAMDMSKGFNIAQHIGPKYLGGRLDNQARIAIHFSHRIGALLTALVCLVFAFNLGSIVPLRKYAWLLVGALIAQISLGATAVALSLPLTIAVMHSAGAACLLLSVILAMYRLREYINKGYLY